MKEYPHAENCPAIVYEMAEQPPREGLIHGWVRQFKEIDVARCTCHVAEIDRLRATADAAHVAWQQANTSARIMSECGPYCSFCICKDGITRFVHHHECDYQDRQEKFDTLTRALTVAKEALTELRKFSHFSTCRFIQTKGVKACDCTKLIVDNAVNDLKEIGNGALACCYFASLPPRLGCGFGRRTSRLQAKSSHRYEASYLAR